jgi:hypothetical protein
MSILHAMQRAHDVVATIYVCAEGVVWRCRTLASGERPSFMQALAEMGQAQASLSGRERSDGEAPDLSPEEAAAVAERGARLMDEVTCWSVTGIAPAPAGLSDGPVEPAALAAVSFETVSRVDAGGSGNPMQGIVALAWIPLGVRTVIATHVLVQRGEALSERLRPFLVG